MRDCLNESRGHRLTLRSYLETLEAAVDLPRRGQAKHYKCSGSWG